MSDEDLNNPGVTDPAAGGGPQDPDQGNEPITREAFIAMRNDLQTKLDALQDQNTLYKTQLAVMHGGGGQRQPKPEELDPLHGREDDDVITVAEFKQYMGRFQAAIGGTLGEVRTATANPDYADVVKNHLPNYLQANPAMIGILKALPPTERAQLAYTLGTYDPGYQAKKTQTPNTDVQRIVDNKKKPQPGAHGSGSPLAKAQRYETMSDADLEKTLSKVKSGQAV